MLGADDSIGPDSYFRFQAPEDGRVRRSGWSTSWAREGPDYSYRIEVTPVVASAYDDDQCRTDPAGNRRDVGRRAQGEPAGDPDLRQSRRLRRRAERGRRRPAGRRDRRGADDRRQPGGRAGALLGQARRAAGRDPGAGHRQAGRSPSSMSRRSSSRCRCWCWARTTSTSGRGRSIAWRSPSPRNAPTRSRSSSPRCRWSGAARWD